jgi:hypothetical protein
MIRRCASLEARACAPFGSARLSGDVRPISAQINNAGCMLHVSTTLLLQNVCTDRMAQQREYDIELSRGKCKHRAVRQVDTVCGPRPVCLDSALF